jgi:hypothetical protein
MQTSISASEDNKLGFERCGRTAVSPTPTGSSRPTNVSIPNVADLFAAAALAAATREGIAREKSSNRRKCGVSCPQFCGQRRISYIALGPASAEASSLLGVLT